MFRSYLLIKSSIETPTLNKENTKLYFSANLPGSLGGKDIFVAAINADGTLGDPINLGDKVNTTKDEITPYIAGNNFLYFSSNGREDSLGSFDIYASEVFENTVSQPLHLESPINSINDDFAYIVSSDKGYFSSNRLQGQQNNDIYSFYIEPDKPEVCYQEVIGTVRDKETEIVMPAVTVTISDDEGVELERLTTDENGNYRYNLDCRATFTVKASKQGYSVEEHIVNTANYIESPSLEVNQSLTKEFKEEQEKVTININPIYFGFDKYNISDNAKLELDKIVKVMKANPDIEVESASHTDSRGTRAYNQGLSERRAKATVDYIVSKGIERARIKSKGYGETQLLNECKDGVRCTIPKHKLNRRTEFVIVNKHVLNKPKESNEGAIIVISESVPKEKRQKDIAPISSIQEKAAAKKTIKKSDTPIIENDKEFDLEPKEGVEKEELPALDNESSDSKKAASTSIKEKDIVEDNKSAVKATVSIHNSKPLVVPDKIETHLQGSNPSNTNTIEYEKEEALSNASSAFKEDVNKEPTTLANNQKGNVLTEVAPQYKKNLETKVVSTKSTNAQSNESTIAKTTLDDVKTNLKQTEQSANTNSKIAKAKKVKKQRTENKDSETEMSTLGMPIEINTSTEASLDGSTKEDKLTVKSNEAINTMSSEENKVPQIASFNNDLTDKKNTTELAEIKNTAVASIEGTQKDDKPITTSNKPINILTSEEDKAPQIASFNKDLTNKKNNMETAFNELYDAEGELFDESKTNKERVKIRIIEEDVLSISSIDISPMTVKRNGIYAETRMANKTDVMRINFKINHHRNITEGYKEVYILIQNPKGIILNRKGVFEPKKGGDKLSYTEKTNAYYANNYLEISMLTDRFIQRIIKGMYTVTIYIEGYPVGLEQLNLS